MIFFFFYFAIMRAAIWDEVQNAWTNDNYFFREYNLRYNAKVHVITLLKVLIINLSLISYHIRYDLLFAFLPNNTI